MWGVFYFPGRCMCFDGQDCTCASSARKTSTTREASEAGCCGGKGGQDASPAGGHPAPAAGDAAPAAPFDNAGDAWLSEGAVLTDWMGGASGIPDAMLAWDGSVGGMPPADDDPDLWDIMAANGHLDDTDFSQIYGLDTAAVQHDETAEEAAPHGDSKTTCVTDEGGQSRQTASGRDD